MLKCEDCGLPYQDFPLDTTVPNSQWHDIHPEHPEGGILCANCMVRRASRLPGIIAARMVFEFAPYVHPEVTRDFTDFSIHDDPLISA